MERVWTGQSYLPTRGVALAVRQASGSPQESTFAYEEMNLGVDKREREVLQDGGSV
jgi:hypothetical protein